MANPITLDLGLLNALFEAVPDALYLIDPETSRILYVNRAGYEELDMQRDEVLEHSVLSLQMDVVGEAQWASIVTAIRKERQLTFIGRHRRSDGSELPVEVNTSVFEHAGREYFLSVARDITERMASSQGLVSRNDQLWFALNEASDGLWDWDIASGEVFFSPQLARMLGYGPHEMSPQLDTWKGNIHPEDQARVVQTLRDHLAGRRERYEAQYRLRNRNGHYLWVHDRGRVSERDAQGNPIRAVGMVQNITDQKMLEAQLLQLASHDALTGLLNRRGGEERLREQLALAQRKQHPLTLCLVDLDHFKEVNDLYGHLSGDHVLRLFADYLRGHVRASDIAFRWGGEEFVLIWPDTDHAGGLTIAERIRHGLTEQKCALDPPVNLTASFGVATFPEHGTQMETLLLDADRALYQAKQAGRDRVVSVADTTLTPRGDG